MKLSILAKSWVKFYLLKNQEDDQIEKDLVEEDYIRLIVVSLFRMGD